VDLLYVVHEKVREANMAFKGGSLSKLNAFPRAEEHLMQKTTTGAAGKFKCFYINTNAQLVCPLFDQRLDVLSIWR
jgi:hypothetical protein